MEISEATIQEIFNLLRANTQAVTELDKKVSVLIDARAQKDKACNDHFAQTVRIDDRVRGLELWRASQEGIAGFFKTWAPVLISLAALFFAVWRI